MSKWTSFQASIYNLIPPLLRRPTNSLRILPSYLSWRLSTSGRKHAKSILSSLHNRYEGYRCIIIGNGPSLNKMDLSVLKDEYTFGLNRIYLLFEKMGFETSFLVTTNGLVLQQFAEDMKSVKSLKIFNWLHRKFYQVDANTVALCAKPGNQITGNIVNGYFLGGGTVTNLALEAAFFLGFSEVILIGVDHTYRAQGQAGAPVVSKGEDQNHFSPDYFGKGIIWQLPNYVTMEHGYAQNRKLFEKANRIVVDGTLEGKLDIFPKVSFQKYLSTSRYKNKLTSLDDNHKTN